MSDKYKIKVPAPPTGSVLVFQCIQTLIGLGGAFFLQHFDAETRLRNILMFDGSSRSFGISLAIVALVAQFVMLPAMEQLVQGRKIHGVGHPIHHPAPKELNSEDDRILFLFKLRAFENIVEWLPVFIAQAVATCVLGYHATTCFLCVPYTLGKTMYAVMYGSGNADARIPGLIVADFCGLLVLRGILIIEIFRHFMSS
jgi:hypothetical protein